MPNIPELTEAFAGLAAAERKARHLFNRRAILEGQMAKLREEMSGVDAKINAKLADARRALQAAEEKQEFSLTRWIESGSSSRRAFHRYSLRAGGLLPDERGGRAWLRKMRCVDGQWRWALDAGADRVVLPETDKPIDEVLKWADDLLRAAEWNLTDFDNDDDAEAARS